MQPFQKTHPKPHFPLPVRQWFVASAAADTISLHRGPRPRQNNLLPLTGGARQADSILKPDDGHTRSERRCLVTHTGQFGSVRGRGRRRLDTALPHRFASIHHDLDTIV